MKKLFLISLLLIGQTVFADYCGKGKITDVMVGAFNTDDVYIALDYSIDTSKHPGTELVITLGTFIGFKKTDLTDDRFKVITALALTAYASGDSVAVYSHNSDCQSSTQISVLK